MSQLLVQIYDTSALIFGSLKGDNLNAEEKPAKENKIKINKSILVLKLNLQIYFYPAHEASISLLSMCIDVNSLMSYF